jgi:hypothetical protein
MKLNDAYLILKVDQTYSYDEIKKSYKDLVQIWHPDRFAGKERLKNKATEELILINQAYELIKSHIKEKSNNNHQEFANDNKIEIITCINCGTKNRVNATEMLRNDIICGSCKKNIKIKFYQNKSTEQNFSDTRQKKSTSHSFVNKSPVEKETKWFLYIPVSWEYLIITILFSISFYYFCKIILDFNLSIYTIQTVLIIYLGVASWNVLQEKSILLFIVLSTVYLFLYAFLYNFFDIKYIHLMNLLLLTFFTIYYYFILGFSYSVTQKNTNISKIFSKLIIIFTSLLMITLFSLILFGKLLMKQ